MKKRIIALLCVAALLLSVLTACQKPDNDEENADNGGAGDNGTIEDSGNIKDDDNIAKPRESITSLHYTGEGQRSEFGYHYYDYRGVCILDPPKTIPTMARDAYIDFETEYSYYPVNDVKIKIFHGTIDGTMRTHKLALTDTDGKLRYISEPSDMYGDEKYAVGGELVSCDCTSTFCVGFYQLDYSYCEEITLSSELFTGSGGCLRFDVYATNLAESGCVTNSAKLYYYRAGDTVRISSSELALTESVITKESDVERSALSKDITYTPHQNGERVGSVVAYKVMLDDNSEDESAKRRIFVALKCDDSRYLVLLYDMTGRYLRGFSFRYEGDISFSFADTYAVVYLWDRALSFAWNSKDYTMGDPREIVDYLENDDIRKALDTLSAKTEAEEYTAELSGSNGAYNKLAVTVDENTVTLDFAE